MNTAAPQGQARNAQPATVPALPDQSIDVSEAARLLAQRRSALRSQQAPPEPQATNEPEVETEDEGQVEESGLESQVDDQVDAQEATAEADDAEPAETEEAADDEAYLVLDGAEIPLAEVRQWRDGAMRADDYQRKTQALSQAQSAIQHQEQELSKFGQYIERLYQSQISAVQSSLERFRNVDWGGLAEKDPAKYTATKAQFEVAKGRWEAVNRDRQQFLSEYDSQVQKSIAMRAEAAIPEIRQRIRGWNNAMYNERMDFVSKTYRVPAEFVAKLTDPWLWEVVNDAYHFRKGKELPKTAAKIVKRSPAVTPRPSARQMPGRPAAQKEAGLLQKVKASDGRSQQQAAIELLRARRQNRVPPITRR